MRFGFNPNRSALLIVDATKAFVEPGGPLEVKGGCEIVPKIKKILETCRALGIPVIHVKHVFRRGGLEKGYMYEFWPILKEGVLEEGSEWVDIHPDISPIDGEIVINKHRYSAWFGTDLDIVVRNLGVDTLIICGTTTDRCTGLTAYEAFMRDLRVVFPEDANATFQEEVHKAMLVSLDMGGAMVIKTEELIRMLIEGGQMSQIAAKQ